MHCNQSSVFVAISSCHAARARTPLFTVCSSSLSVSVWAHIVLLSRVWCVLARVIGEYTCTWMRMLSSIPLQYSCCPDACVAQLFATIHQCMCPSHQATWQLIDYGSVFCAPHKGSCDKRCPHYYPYYNYYRYYYYYYIIILL